MIKVTTVKTRGVGVLMLGSAFYLILNIAVTLVDMDRFWYSYDWPSASESTVNDMVELSIQIPRNDDITFTKQSKTNREHN